MRAQFPLRQQCAFGVIRRQQLAANQGASLITDKAAAPHRAGNVAFGFQLGVGHLDGIARNAQPCSQHPAGRKFRQIWQIPRRHLLFDGQMQRRFARHALLQMPGKACL
ncbi:hypothetical protein D3C79_185360 [compost metagenome]